MMQLMPPIHTPDPRLARPEPPLDPTLREHYDKCYRSTAAFASTFFPDRFSRKFDPGHYEIFDALDDDSIKLLVILAPRGVGKTSIASVAFPAKRLLFGQSKYVLYISSNFKYASKHTTNLRLQLETNDELIGTFGVQKTNQWSVEQFVLANGGYVEPRGAEQNLRGGIYGHARPDLIILDDIESDETIRSEEQTKKINDWLHGAVMNAIDRGSDNWRIVYIGTMLGENAVIANLIEDPAWRTIILELCGDDLKSKWPHYMSDAKVKALYEDHKNSVPPTLDTFCREQRNLPISREDAVFQQSTFQHYREDDEDFTKHRNDLVNFVLVDPGKTVKPTASESAVVGVGVDPARNRYYVRDVVAGHFHPDETYDAAIKMMDRLGARDIGIEVTSLHDFIVRPFQEELVRRGKGYTLHELNARGKKEERVRALVSYYRQGLMWHNEPVTRGLEAQLLSFPRSRRWDIMDALAYMIPMVVEGYLYLLPENLTEDPKKIEAEYADLPDDDDPFESPDLIEVACEMEAP